MGVPPSAIARWRSEWSERFVDTCVVSRVTGRGTFNVTTQQYDTPSSSTIYSGGALVRPMGAADQADFGLERVTLENLVVYLPHTVAAIHPEDRVTFSAAEYETQLVGAVLVVLAEHRDSWNTRRKLACRYDEGTGYVDPG